MDRTLYWNKTRPTQEQLNFTETSKINSILRRQRSTTQLGTVSGFRVTVNPINPTQIDIGPGEGYTGGRYRLQWVGGEESAEHISTLTDSSSGITESYYTAQGQSLAIYTSGAKNYVSLEYIETTDTPLAEIYYPFENRNTEVHGTYSVSVLTEAEWEALSLADLKKHILVGIVTANGAGVALTSASIQQVIQPKTHPIPSATSALTGVLILGVSDDTMIGTGVLRFEFSTRRLFWTAPGDVEGSGVTVTSSDTYTIYSNDPAYHIAVSVTTANLPTLDQSDDINIESLYGADIPRYSAVDSVHRDMLGSGYPTPGNPHATTWNDIPGGTFDHADHFHVNGIAQESEANFLLPDIDGVNDRVRVYNHILPGNYFLIDGRDYATLAGIETANYGVVGFEATEDSGEYMVYIDNAGNVQKVLVGDSFWSANVILMDIKNAVAGNGTLSWDAVTYAWTWQAPGDMAAGTPVYSPFILGTDTYYIKLYSSNTENWIIVRVSGTPGATNNSTVAIAKNETEHSDESILKIAIVHWDAALEDLDALTFRDIRQYCTADNRSRFEEEHSSLGVHDKVLRHTFRVSKDDSVAIAGYAETVAIYGSASAIVGGYFLASASALVGQCVESAVIGIAASDTAVYGIAANGNYGGYFTAAGAGGAPGADGSYGVYGRADSAYGVAGIAAASIGVYGSATNTAIHATAENARAVLAQASAYGVFAQATVTALFATAAANDAVFAQAEDSYAVRAKVVAGPMAVSATAANTVMFVRGAGVRGIDVSMGGNYGVIATAANSVLAGYAVNSIGLYGSAPITAAYITVDANVGLKIEGGADYGLYASVAARTAVYGSAASYGVYGAASAIYGVYGTAQTVGVGGSASISQDVECWGVQGQAINTSVSNKAVGVYGYVVGSAATGVAGFAAHATYGTGVYGLAGISGSGVVGKAGSAGNGVYGSALVGVVGTGVQLGVWGVCADVAGTGALFSGGRYGMQVEALIRYNQAIVAGKVAPDDEYVEINIGGNTRYLKLYTDP